MAYTHQIPLAQILRPSTLDEIVGQRHLVAPGAPFRRCVEQDKIKSFILYGPAGTGKTTIAHVVSKMTKSRFIMLNASNAKIDDLRKQAEAAKKNEYTIVVCIDESHRWSSTQQDALLPYVESGYVIFIGATTENPFHSMNSPLLSRSQIFTLEKLTPKDIMALIVKGIKYYRENGKNISIEEEAAKWIIKVSCGDGRKALVLLEMAAQVEENITKDTVETLAPSKYVIFTDDMHYDLASWMQGAIQASDPDAAVFALAKWLESGEDPRYIARRILVSASEDACTNTNALITANSAYLAASQIGRPECDIIMANAVIAIATAKRDKSAAMAIWSAVKDVRENLDVEVPKEMRDGHFDGAKQLGHGAYHDGQNKDQYVGVSKTYYRPW